MLSSKAHVGATTPATGGEVVYLESPQRALVGVGATRRVELPADRSHGQCCAARGRVRQPGPPVAARVVPVQRGHLTAQVAAPGIAADHVDVAAVRGRGGMVQCDRHRSHATPPVAAQVVALDSRRAATAAPLEAADHVDEAAHARSRHFRAREKGGVQCGPAPGRGCGGRAPAAVVPVGEDDCRATPSEAQHEHCRGKPRPCHVPGFGSGRRCSYPAHSVTGRRG